MPLPITEERDSDLRKLCEFCAEKKAPSQHASVGTCSTVLALRLITQLRAGLFPRLGRALTPPPHTRRAAAALQGSAPTLFQGSKAPNKRRPSGLRSRNAAAPGSAPRREPVLTFTRGTIPFSRVAADSYSGANRLQCPHLGARKGVRPAGCPSRPAPGPPPPAAPHQGAKNSTSTSPGRSARPLSKSASLSSTTSEARAQRASSRNSSSAAGRAGCGGRGADIAAGAGRAAGPGAAGQGAAAEGAPEPQPEVRPPHPDLPCGSS